MKTTDHAHSIFFEEIKTPFVIWRQEWRWGTCVSLPLLLLYLVTMPHTVTLEDSGLLITTAHFAGIAYPTGYPLYTMLGKLFTLLPLGSIAFRMHLLSAVMGAVSCGIFYLCILMLVRIRWIGLFMALLYGISATFWAQAIVAEVYTLHVLFYFSILSLCLKLKENFHSALLYTTAFLYGLSLSHHWPLMILGSGCYVLILYERWRLLLSVKHLILSFLCLAAGLSPYLYLIIRSQFEPYINAWGLVNNLEDLWWYITRQVYLQDRNNVPWLENFIQTTKYLKFFGKQLLVEFSIPGCATAILGAVVLWHRFPKKLFWAFLFAFLSSALLLKIFQRNIYAGFTRDMYLVYQLVPFGIAIISGSVFFKWVQELPQFSKKHKNLFLGLLAFIMFSWTFITNWKQNNSRQDTFAFDYARIVLESLPQNAYLFLGGNTDSGPFLYAHQVEKIRPDIQLYSQFAFSLNNRLYSIRNNALEAITILNQFIEEKKTIYAPTLHQDFRHTLPSLNDVSFNGLYYQISKDSVPFPEGKNLLNDAQQFLDNQLSGKYKNSWPSIRTDILYFFCDLVLSHKQDHPFLYQHPACQSLIAQRFFAQGQLEQARDLHHTLIEKVPPPFLDSEKWHTIYEQYFVAAMALLNQNLEQTEGESPLVLANSMQWEVDLVYPIIDMYPQCHNKVLRHLLEVYLQVPIKLPVSQIQEKFGHCAQLRPLLDMANRFQ